MGERFNGFPPEPLGDGGDNPTVGGFKVITGILKMVVGLAVGFFAAGVLMGLVLWHMLREVDRIDREMYE